MDEWIDGRKNVKWIAGINGIYCLICFECLLYLDYINNK